MPHAFERQFITQRSRRVLQSNGKLTIRLFSGDGGLSPLRKGPDFLNDALAICSFDYEIV